MAQVSRTYLLPKAAHPVTGLMPDYSEFDGTPKAIGSHANFEYDAWRNIMNMSFDFSWFQKNGSDIQPLIDRQIDFFKDKPNYTGLWTLDGTTTNNSDHNPGLFACNAVAALALEDTKVWPFVDELFESPIPVGRYRYYDGLLYMMSYMHLAGEFKVYKPDGDNGNRAPKADFTVNPSIGVAPETVNLDASDSSDPDGDILTYSWDFGDGITGSGVTVDHEYTIVGEYIIILTVSDGEKQDTETRSVSITDGSPLADFVLSTTTGVVPLNVNFDASRSIDPTGGVLTYSWDYGNGETASSVTGTTTYTDIGEVTVTLTVTNLLGKTDTTTQTILVREKVSCAYDTPINTSLPKINNQYQHIYVLGEGGPNLDNVAQLTINWDLINNGLYQFSLNTNNGIPGWYVDFSQSVIQNFNESQPEVMFANTGFEGLDGGYWVTVNEDDFIMVSKNEGFTIYFSNSSIAPECNGGGNGSDVNGGVITGGPFNFIVGDGITDHVSGITLTDNVGQNSQWVITDDQSNIVGLPADPEDVDFDSAAPGTCLIWHLSYNDEIVGVQVGNNVSDLDGDFDLSNAITVIRREVIVGDGDCSFGAPVPASLSSINKQYDYVYVLGMGGPNLDNVTNLTMNWDENNNGLYQFSMNTNNGTPNWWNDFLPKMVQSFNSIQPEITLTDSGFSGLDGSYWVALHEGNFVMVSKTGGFTIYFSDKNTVPDCLDDTKETDASMIVSGIIIYPNPANSSFTIIHGKKLFGAQVSIMNLQGAKIPVGTISESKLGTTLEVSELPVGIYLLEVILEDGKKEVKQIVIE